MDDCTKKGITNVALDEFKLLAASFNHKLQSLASEHENLMTKLESLVSSHPINQNLIGCQESQAEQLVGTSEASFEDQIPADRQGEDALFFTSETHHYKFDSAGKDGNDDNDDNYDKDGTSDMVMKDPLLDFHSGQQHQVVRRPDQTETNASSSSFEHAGDGFRESNRLKRREILRRMNLLDRADKRCAPQLVFLQHSEEAYLNSAVKDLLQKFHRMDPANTGFVGTGDFRIYLYQRHGNHGTADHANVTLSDAIQKFNLVNTYVSRNDSRVRQGQLSFEAFVDMMLAEDLTQSVGKECSQIIHEVRRHMTVDSATDMVAGKTGLTNESVLTEITDGILSHKLEFAGLVAIFLHAIFIGISADNDTHWIIYQIIETAFAAFFACECLYKMHNKGLRHYFLGEDKGWNMFEVVLVVAALLDFVSYIAVEASFVTKAKIPLLRVFRLARLTRAIRVLRLKQFKDVVLMVSGMMYGSSTMMWILFLFLTVIYIIGVALKIFFGPEQAFGCEAEPSWCTSSMVKIDRFRNDLFSSVSRSMFTVFRCFVDGCAAPDGTPLMVYVYNVYGWWAMFLYVLVTFAVTFGLFNLIMAIFVENTLESARANEHRRHELKRNEYIKTAQRLHNVVTEFIEFQEQGPLSIFSGMDHDSFCAAVGQPKVLKMLHDLEISISRPEELFDVLDADRSGTVSVSEMVDGLMKLRRGKIDTVETQLAIRALQKSVSGLEVSIMRQLAGLQRLMSQWQP